MNKQEIMNKLNIDNTNKYKIIKDPTFKTLGENLKFYDPTVVELASFTPPEADSPIRFFKYKMFDDFRENVNFNKTVRKPSSRSQLSANRDPFEIEAENQILVDDASAYGTLVDNNIEDFYNDKTAELLVETEMSIDNILGNGLVWVGRSVMICHPQGYAYGEVDELLYSPETDTYYVGDTKTSSNVYSAGYGYQLALYIEILQLLNPDKKFSPIGKINWVKVKDKKWKFNRDWEEQYRVKYGEMPPKNIAKDDVKDHPIYTAKWNEKVPIEPVLTKKMVDIDVEALKLLNVVRAEIYLIYTLLPKYGFYGHASELPKAVASNEVIRKFNDELQQKYNQIKLEMEK